MRVQLLVLLSSLLLVQACGSAPQKTNSDKAIETYVELGLKQFSAGDRDLARQNLVRALNLDANSPVANNAIAILYQADTELELAEKHFRLAIRRDPSFTQARNNYALFLYRSGRFEDARDQYQAVVDDVNYRLRPQGFIGLALSEKSLGDFDAAEAALQRSLSLSPRNGGASIELALLKMDQNDFVSAKEYLDIYERSNQSTPRSLALGMQLAERFGDQNGRDSYAMGLKNMYPNSRQARELMLAEQAEKAQ